MSRAVLEVVSEEDLLLHSLHHGTSSCGEQCRGRLQYTSLCPIHCVDFVPLIKTNFVFNPFKTCGGAAWHWHTLGKITGKILSGP